MSVLVVGMSHRSAPIELLERVSLDPSAAVKLSHLALEAPSVTESAVVSTCNRVEIYVETDRFHGATSWSPTSTSITTTRRSRISSPSHPGSTR